MQRHDNNFPDVISVRLFFLLLHGGLNGRLPTLDLPTVSPREWDAILRMARLQAVTALVWDGIQLLPDELKPPVDIGRQFFMDTLRTEQTARRLNSLLATLLADVETTGIAVALLKGQGYAALYPNPLHRQPGDIDIYSGPECARLQRALPPAYERDNGPAYFHDKLHRDGILIENHRLVAELAWRPHKRALERMVSEWFPANICRRTSLGLSLPVPPPWFELVHAVIHFAQHLTGGGVGLRQLCDWLVLIRTHREHVDRNVLAQHLQQLGLRRIAGAMTRLCVDWLGLEADHPFVQALLVGDAYERRTARRILQDVMLVGNFGQEEHIRRHSGVARETADLLRRRGARTLRYFALWPNEMIWRPFIRLTRFTRRKLTHATSAQVRF